MTRAYTPAEMLARQEALRNVHTMDDVRKLAQPMHNTSARQPYATNGKIMQSRYNGKCVDCGGWINAGDTIRYDGKAHHYPACPQEAKPDPMEGWNEETQTWDADPLGTWDAQADDFRSAPKPVQQSFAPVAQPASTALANGKWTLQFADGHHRTFKLHTQKADATFAPGERIVKYLARRDNEDENSYVGFAFLKDDKLVIWKRFRADSALVQDAQVLLDPAAAQAAGKAYALASCRCYRCGHDLTVKESIESGLGSKCAKLLGA